MKIPFRIPEPDRSELIAAGKEAVLALKSVVHDKPETSAPWRTAHKRVEAVISTITLKHGIEE